MKYIKTLVFSILWISLVASGLTYVKDQKRLENEESVYFEHPAFEKAISIYENRTVIGNKKDLNQEKEVYLFFDTYEPGILNDLKMFASLEYLNTNCLSDEMLLELSAFQNIKKLELANFDEKVHFAHLSQLKGLRELTLNGTLTQEQMHDVRKLSNLTNLGIENGTIDKLELPPKLKTLSLVNVVIEDGTFQETLPNLTKLYVKDVSVIRGNIIELLRSMEGVTDLTVRYVKLDQVNVINQLKNLQNLQLYKIGLTDLTPIDSNQLPKLKQIQVSEEIQMDSGGHIEDIKKTILER